MNRNIGDKKYKLKNIKKSIEDATERKELVGIQSELQELEREIEMLGNPDLQRIYFKKAQTLKTHLEVYNLKKEVQGLQKDVSKRKEELRTKDEKIDVKDQEKEKFLGELDDLEKSKAQFIRKIEDAIKDSAAIYKKVKRDIEVTKTVEIVKKRQSVLLETLMLVYLAKSNMNKMIKIPLSIALVSDICQKLSVKDEEIIHYEYHYEDLEEIIDRSLDNIVDIEEAMMESLESVSDMRKDYEQKFGEFKHLKEFQDILGMLDTIEKTLDQELGNVKDVEKDLGKSLDENKEKVLKLDSLNGA